MNKESLCSIAERYPELDTDRLIVQLAMMRQQDLPMSYVDATAVKLASLEPAVRNMFDQVEQLVRPLLTVPSSNAEAERSFSALRRLKTYLCNSMRQDHLNHIALLCTFIKTEWTLWILDTLQMSLLTSAAVV